MRTFKGANQIARAARVKLGTQLCKFRVVEIRVSNRGEVCEFDVAGGCVADGKSSSIGDDASRAAAARQCEAGCDSRSSREAGEILAGWVNRQALMRILPNGFGCFLRTTHCAVLRVVRGSHDVTKFLCRRPHDFGCVSPAGEWVKDINNWPLARR